MLRRVAFVYNRTLQPAMHCSTMVHGQNPNKCHKTDGTTTSWATCKTRGKNPLFINSVKLHSQTKLLYFSTKLGLCSYPLYANIKSWDYKPTSFSIQQKLSNRSHRLPQQLCQNHEHHKLLQSRVRQWLSSHRLVQLGWARPRCLSRPLYRPTAWAPRRVMPK